MGGNSPLAHSPLGHSPPSIPPWLIGRGAIPPPSERRRRRKFSQIMCKMSLSKYIFGCKLCFFSPAAHKNSIAKLHSTPLFGLTKNVLTQKFPACGGPHSQQCTIYTPCEHRLLKHFSNLQAAIVVSTHAQNVFTNMLAR